MAVGIFVGFHDAALSKVPQGTQGVAARSSKVVGSVMQYNHGGAIATAEVFEHWRRVRNHVGATLIQILNTTNFQFLYSSLRGVTFEPLL